MSLLRGIVEKVLEVGEDYVIARCHQSVRFDRSTFDFKFTRDLENIKEGYTWVLQNNYGETLCENRTPEDEKMLKDFSDRMKCLSQMAKVRHEVEMALLTDEEKVERKAKSDAFWQKIKDNSYPIKRIT